MMLLAPETAPDRHFTFRSLQYVKRLGFPFVVSLNMVLVAGCPTENTVPSPAPDDTSAATLEVTTIPAASPTSTPEGDDDVSLPGDDDVTLPATPTATPMPYELQGHVSVVVDEWGMPHVYASAEADAFWGQGYMHAKDRLWQVDLTRRIALGRASEILGERSYTLDQYYRAFKFEQLCQQTYARIQVEDPEVAAVLDAYSAGVNAYLDDALKGNNGAALPPQIEALAYKPEPFRPVDALAIDKLMTYNLSTTTDVDLNISAVVELLDPSVALDMIRVQPIDDAVVVPDFFGPPKVAGPQIAPSPMKLGVTVENIARVQEAFRAIRPIFNGSNNWVVSGDHTSTGAPLLANDTHEGLESPATYYQIHLSTAEAGGDLDVSGYSFPGAPAIAFGNNRYCAWGVTNNYADVADIYRETESRDNTLLDGNWVPMEVRTEVFGVRREGGTVDAPEIRRVDMRVVPHHGPVLPTDVMGGLPVTVSVRWIGWTTVNAYRTFLDLAHAQSFADLQEALTTYHVGAMNFVFANVEGDIGYTGRVDIPIREKLDPEQPPFMLQSGAGDLEWTEALLPDDKIPNIYNPAVGFVASANNDTSGNVQDNDIFNDPYYISAIYDLGTRATRISQRLEVLKAKVGGMSLEDMAGLQADTYSLFATHFVPYLVEAAENRPDLVTGSLVDGVEMLGDWDYECDDNSGESFLFHAWLAFGLRAVFADETVGSLFDNLSADYINMLARPLAFFLEETKDSIHEIEAGNADFPSVSKLNYFDNQNTTVLETRDEVLLESLRDTVNWLSRFYGAPLTWDWASHHNIYLTDRVGDIFTDSTTGPYPTDGGYFTVDVAEFPVTKEGLLVDEFDVKNGPSQRTLYSLERNNIVVWDSQPGGASEDPSSPLFNLQLEDYLANEYHERPFYLADVQAHALETLNFESSALVRSVEALRKGHDYRTYQSR